MFIPRGTVLRASLRHALVPGHAETANENIALNVEHLEGMLLVIEYRLAPRKPGDHMSRRLQ
jgi:hypothetical protein